MPENLEIGDSQGQSGRGRPTHLGLHSSIRELDRFGLQMQRLTRQLDREEDPTAVIDKLRDLKRSVMERFPLLFRKIRRALVELEFWQPGLVTVCDGLWLDRPELIQGSETWLRFLGRLRRLLLDAIGPNGIVTAPAMEHPPFPVSLRQPSPGGVATETEPHYTVQQLAERWRLDQSTVRRLFQDEPGVLRIPHLGRRGKRDYVSLRIPASVAARVHERLSRSLLKVQ